MDEQGFPTTAPKRWQGIAAYSFQGSLDADWDPAYSGSYSPVWALHAEGLRLHTGGEFKRVSGVVQNSYARLSPASLQEEAWYASIFPSRRRECA
jgi:hypothetical protein